MHFIYYLICLLIFLGVSAFNSVYSINTIYRQHIVLLQRKELKVLCLLIQYAFRVHEIWMRELPHTSWLEATLK